MAFYLNSDCEVVGKIYLKFLFDTREYHINKIMIDRRTETGQMSSMQAYLADKECLFEHLIESVIYGPSTLNKAEHW